MPAPSLPTGDEMQDRSTDEPIETPPDPGLAPDASEVAEEPHAAGGDQSTDDGESPDATTVGTPAATDPLAVAEAQRDEYLADLQRVQAEFDNFRKRMMRDGTAQRSAGVAEVVTKLLDVLDDFDMAVLSVDKTDDVASLHKGLELVYSKLIDTVRSFGVVRVDETGVAFDPERHEAVQSVDADEPRDEPVVIDVLRPGYLLGERVLRAAMVKVEK